MDRIPQPILVKNIFAKFFVFLHRSNRNTRIEHSIQHRLMQQIHHQRVPPQPPQRWADGTAQRLHPLPLYQVMQEEA